VPFYRNIHDGLAISGLAIDKSNWAQQLDKPPYETYSVTTGITFTFGGLKITNNAEVEDTTGHPIPGLYAAGEIAGRLFTITPAAPASCPAPSSAASLARTRRRGRRGKCQPASRSHRHTRPLLNWLRSPEAAPMPAQRSLFCGSVA
jgi:tricarballylate dehydrogenase